MNQENVLKLAATQNVIRSKFKKAYKNRIEHEHDVNHVMKSLTTKPVASAANHTSQMHSTSKSRSISNKINYHDSNKLCTRLKLLIASVSKNDCARMKCMRQINVILDDLRKREIII